MMERVHTLLEPADGEEKNAKKGIISNNIYPILFLSDIRAKCNAGWCPGHEEGLYLFVLVLCYGGDCHKRIVPYRSVIVIERV